MAAKITGGRRAAPAPDSAICWSKVSCNPFRPRTLPIRAAAEGFRAIAQGQHIGKLVLRVDPDCAPTEVRDPQRSVVRPDSTYLITGGTSGLGLLIARVLANAGARHLVLLSRRGRVSDADASDLG